MPSLRLSFSRHPRLWIWLLPLIAVGCIGTDFVDDPVVTVPPRIQVQAGTTALLPGQMAQLTATFYDDLGVVVPQTAFAWISSDEAVATVSADGTVTGVAAGLASIQAAANDVVSAAVSINVVADANQVAQIVVGPAAPGLQPGQTHQFQAMPQNVNGDPVAAGVTWASDDVAVATVDANGLVTAVAPGMAQITARADGVASSPAAVQVLGASRTGTFQPKPGTSYTVSGTATLREDMSGGLILELSNDFRSSEGPALAIYLSNSTGVDGSSFKVEDLTSVTGPQTFPISGVGLNDFRHVVIHCVPFNVTFGWATLGN